MWTWQGLFCKLSQGGLTSTLESELASHIVIFALQSSWWSLSFLRARIWPDCQCSCSSQRCTLWTSFSLTAPAWLSPSSDPSLTQHQQPWSHLLWSEGWSSCDTLGGSTNSAFPSQGWASLCRHTAELAAIVCWEIRTFTPGDRSTWHPGDAVSYPAASRLQRRPRNGIFTLICVGLHETLG